MGKIVNILVSVIFLLSFVGVQINKHYSNGKLYSVAIFNEAESCCEAVESCHIDHKTTNHAESSDNENCSCNNETEYLIINNVFIDETLYFAKIFSVEISILAHFETLEASQFSYFQYNRLFYFSLPSIFKDLQKDFNIFLC